MLGAFAIAFFGIDLPADIRDLSHDLKYWESSWGHAAETALSAAAIFPIIGVIKHGDEVGVIVKDAEKGLETIKLKGGIKGASNLIDDDLAKMYKNIQEGLGSTGRTIPNTLKEQLAMKQVLSSPLDGATDLSGRLKLGDKRWSEADGWIKMSNNVDGIEIHFVYNKITKKFDDFKFK